MIQEQSRDIKERFWVQVVGIYEGINFDIEPEDPYEYLSTIDTTKNFYSWLAKHYMFNSFKHRFLHCSVQWVFVPKWKKVKKSNCPKIVHAKFLGRIKICICV